jgi:hypothetical protein
MPRASERSARAKRRAMAPRRAGVAVMDINCRAWTASSACGQLAKNFRLLCHVPCFRTGQPFRALAAGAQLLVKPARGRATAARSANPAGGMTSALARKVGDAFRKSGQRPLRAANGRAGARSARFWTCGQGFSYKEIADKLMWRLRRFTLCVASQKTARAVKKRRPGGAWLGYQRNE